MRNKSYYLQPGNLVECRGKGAVILELQGDHFYLIQFKDGTQSQRYGNELKLINEESVLTETKAEREVRLARIAKQAFEAYYGV